MQSLPCYHRPHLGPTKSPKPRWVKLQGGGSPFCLATPCITASWLEEVAVTCLFHSTA